MLRFISFLFNKPYETCKSCETLKEQLMFEREEKKRLTDTLLNIIQPKVVESSPIELAPVSNSSVMFTRRRAALEAKDREEARIRSTSTNLGKPDIELAKSIEKLEEEVGLTEEKGA